jgi:hypothetical protein
MARRIGQKLEEFASCPRINSKSGEQENINQVLYFQLRAERKEDNLGLTQSPPRHQGRAAR